MSCKELIDIFDKCGGKFICNYDKRECQFNGQTAKVTKDDKVVLGHYLSQYAYSGQFDKFVTFIHETEQNKKSPFLRELIHDYQEKNTGGFMIEFTKDKDGFHIPVK